jgi:hypothetical protein
MRIPKQLKIGAHIYAVNIRKIDGQESTENCGITSRINSEIAISKDLPPSHRGATLFHETLHALNSELDHTLLESLGEQLYQVLSENNLLK